MWHPYTLSFTLFTLAFVRLLYILNSITITGGT